MLINSDCEEFKMIIYKKKVDSAKCVDSLWKKKEK